MHPTPLRGPKIGAFLKVKFRSTVVPIYWAARVMRKAFAGLNYSWGLYSKATVCN